MGDPKVQKTGKSTDTATTVHVVHDQAVEKGSKSLSGERLAAHKKDATAPTGQIHVTVPGATLAAAGLPAGPMKVIGIPSNDALALSIAVEANRKLGKKSPDWMKRAAETVDSDAISLKQLRGAWAAVKARMSAIAPEATKAARLRRRSSSEIVRLLQEADVTGHSEYQRRVETLLGKLDPQPHEKTGRVHVELLHAGPDGHRSGPWVIVFPVTSDERQMGHASVGDLAKRANGD